MINLLSRVANATINIDKLSGFLHLSDDNSDNLFQCCVNSDGSINDDAGANDGICGDINYKFYQDYDVIRQIEIAVIKRVRQNNDN